MKLLRQILLIGLLLVILLLIACNDRQQTVEIEDDSVIDLAGLVDHLQAAGATVEMAGTVSQPFFTPQGQVISVNSQDAQVFEYESEGEAKSEADLVSPDGGSVGASMMNWIATPHFYNSGKLIVLYVGDDIDTITLLEAALGTQYAGG
jgi:hypothetical protein